MTITLLAPDGVPITAQQYRQANAAVYGGGAGRPLGGRSGFRVDTPSNVLTATGTTWTLGPCSAMIDPGAAVAQGMYGWSSDANITGSVTAADSTNGRLDIVYIQVNDSGIDSSGAKSANVYYLAGTASTTPVAPTLPPRSLLVGTISVPKAGSGSPSVTINPTRFVAAGSVQPVWSASEFNALTPFEGFAVRRMDLARTPTMVYRSGAWGYDTPGTVAYLSDGTISTGLDGVGVMCNSVTVSLSAGRRYRAVYIFSARSSEASVGVTASFRTSGSSDTSASGTTLPFDKVIYTSARTSSWGAQRVEVTWMQSADSTVAVKAVLARNVGAASYDISDRVLYVEEIGFV